MEPIITFSTAKLAVEKIGRGPIRRGFGAKFYHPRTQNLLWDGRTGRCNVNSLYPAHTQVALQRYLREKYYVVVSVYSPSKGYYIGTSISFNRELGYFRTSSVAFTSWEEALESTLVLTLNLLP